MSVSRRHARSKTNRLLRFIAAPIVLGMVSIIALYGILLLFLGSCLEMRKTSRLAKERGDTKCRSQTPTKSS